MVDPLAPLLADGVIDEVVARLKSGKEADLFLVRHGGQIVAAKVYKARQARSFRNNAAYKEGRQVRDTRLQRAMDRGSRFGQAAAEEAWKSKEADALYALHAAGVRVPAPVMFYQGVLLMEVVVDAHGHPAPRLVDAHVPREQAAALYADLRAQAVRMLACDLIHGDLSPYNVLVGWNGPVVIDFPQVIGAAHNSQARSFFQRDLENLRRFFAHLDPSLHAAAGDAQEIWRAYERRELHRDFVPSGRPPPSPPARAAGPGQAQRGRTPGPAPGHAQHGRAPGPAPGHAQHGRAPGPAPGNAQHGRAPAAGAGPASHRPARRPEPPRAQRERRRDAPMPEVVRVTRTPPAAGPAASAPGPASKPQAHAPHAHAPPHAPEHPPRAHGGSRGQGAPATGGHGRRRRRHRSGQR